MSDFEYNRYDLDLLNTCQAVHQHLSGSGDPMPPEAYDAAITWLRRRSVEWTPSTPRFSGYDMAVLKLVQETLWEAYRAESEAARGE